MTEPICYCFGYTATDIQADVAVNRGRSPILERIVAAKRDGECQCGDTHPDGR